MRTVVLPGVLRPPNDCRLLVASMRDRGLARGARVLDVFTGSGAMAIAAALDGASKVTAVDVSRRAVHNVRLNAMLNRVRVDVRRGDLFGPVAGELFDLVVANPPYVPGPSDELPTRGASRAWEGGTDGRQLLDRFCAEVGDHLVPGGSALVVHSSLNGEADTTAVFERSGLDSQVVARRRGALGPLASERTELLERRGLLAAGEREEELLVFEARLSPY